MPRRVDKVPPYFPLYYKDAYTDASFVALGWEAQGLFWRLACWQWDDGSIPADVDLVWPIVGKKAQTKRLWPKMLERFRPLPDDPSRLANVKLAELRDETLDRRKRQADGAAITNAKRWHSDQSATDKRLASRVANANATVPVPIHQGPGEGAGGETETPDFSQAALLVSKLEGVGFKIDPDPQLVVAWMSRYGYDLILETVHDVAAECLGKHFRYFEAILQSRSENPNERPGNRRAKRDGRRTAPEVGGAETRPPSGPRAVDFGHRTIDDILGKVPAVPGSTPGGSTGNLPGV